MLRSFLGMANYFRCFVNTFSNLVMESADTVEPQQSELVSLGAFRGIIDTPSQIPSSLDVIQYLPLAETVTSCKPEGGCALHFDRGLLTLIWSDTVEGLQVVNTKTGLFEDVLLPQGYILILPGYTLQRATCGIYKAAAHRVTMRDVEGERLAVTFKLRSSDTALLGFHTALTGAGKQVEPRFAGPIRVIELLAMFDEMHPSINNAGCRPSFKIPSFSLVSVCSPSLTHINGIFEGERALTISTPESRSKLHNQHAPKQAAQQIQVPDTAELIRRHIAEQERSPDIFVFLKTHLGETITLEVHKSWNIGVVKSLIQIVLGTPVDDIRLIHAGRQLQDKHLLSDYNIPREATLHMVLGLRGD
ncbi:hypothetical protein WJX77_006616 [Trebouxia sp. C0004]